ncbi:MAG TPA: anthranilate phosphoribosyltransferase [Solirubrobacteraceae bacterium]|nr:anthranilate phosphoribosyltransferase [Solirubrobacteraceae bacterium]
MANDVLTRAIDALAQRRDLSADETAAVLGEIMHGQASDVQIAGFLIALRTKGETVDELVGLARTMRALAARVPTGRDDLLDTAGTGGGRRTFNVSTTAALIAAGAGCAVAKHGNRSVTSRSGSADVLEALGARIDLDPEGVASCIEEVGFGFMFAPAHHQATRYVVPVRRELAVRTIFNLLGPLTNPAGARRQVIGVARPAAADTVAGALARLGADRALIVSSDDGLDEFSICAATKVVEVDGEQLRHYSVVPEDIGVESVPVEAFEQGCAGGAPEDNAAVTRALLEGQGSLDGARAADSLERARADLAAINAGAAIYAGGGADTIAQGVEAARAALRDGSAAAALDRYVRASHAHAPAQALR